jgi:hypothetical protein
LLGPRPSTFTERPDVENKAGSHSLQSGCT